MKLQTKQEIKKLARESAGEPVSDSDLIAQWKCYIGGYEKGYTQAQQDLLASASEGFEEWIKHNVGNSGISKPVALTIWQAAKLSDAKEIEKRDAVFLSQEKERQRTEAFWKEKLGDIQKENEELIGQLKWALSCIDMNLKEADWNKASRLMVIHSVSHQQVCWDHPEIIEEVAKIKGEAK